MVIYTLHHHHNYYLYPLRIVFFEAMTQSVIDSNFYHYQFLNFGCSLVAA